jgi:iron-sulfur cluster repair protein YtfE (RIC family)
MSITLRTTLRDLLARRPRAVEVLEIAMGEGFWHDLDFSLAEAARDHALDPESLLRRLSSLPGTAPGSDFDRSPLYALLDFLTADHRRFREDDLPGLERMLAEAAPEEFGGGTLLEDLRASLHSFKIDFLLHMHEEEEFLFPKALRTEASVLHPELSSESFRGSVGAYSAVMLHTPEQQVKELAAALVRQAGEAVDLSPALSRFRERLEDFSARLVRHADLETRVLMPRALAMEKILHRRLMEEDRASDPG